MKLEIRASDFVEGQTWKLDVGGLENRFLTIKKIDNIYCEYYFHDHQYSNTSTLQQMAAWANRWNCKVVPSVSEIWKKLNEA
jgi:hypothetical protein